MTPSRVVLALMVIALAVRRADAQTTPPVDQLVAAHDSSLQLLHSGDFVVRTQELESFDVDRYRATFECRLRFSGERRRITQISLKTPRPSVRFYVDAYSDGTTRWELLDYDRRQPPPITPMKSQGACGGITLEDPGTRAQQVLSPLESMLLQMHLGPGSPSTGTVLRQFVAAFSRAEVRGQETVDGDSCWKLRLHGPAPSLELSDSEDFVELFLAPTVGFRVRQKIVHRAHFNLVNPSGQGTTVGVYRVTTKVSRFQEYAPGVFLPAESACWVELGGNVRRLPVARCTFQVNSVNAPIDAEAFQFEFPEYLQVADLREGGDRLKMYVWDKGNKPGVQFTSSNDLMQFSHLDRAPSRWKTWVGGIAAMLTVVVLSTIMYRKYRELR